MESSFLFRIAIQIHSSSHDCQPGWWIEKNSECVLLALHHDEILFILEIVVYRYIRTQKQHIMAAFTSQRGFRETPQAPFKTRMMMMMMTLERCYDDHKQQRWGGKWCLGLWVAGKGFEPIHWWWQKNGFSFWLLGMAGCCCCCWCWLRRHMAFTLLHANPLECGLSFFFLLWGWQITNENEGHLNFTSPDLKAECPWLVLIVPFYWSLGMDLRIFCDNIVGMNYDEGLYHGQAMAIWSENFFLWNCVFKYQRENA